MNRRIYLVRHGEIDCGGEKRYIGITDLPLSRKGMDQAYSLREYFSGISMEKAYTSPLTRCIQTSGIILRDRGIEAVQAEAFKEINMGEWEYMPFDHIKSRFPEQYEKRGQYMDSFIPPGGESFIQLRERVMPVFERIVDSVGGNILIVAHAGVNRVILSGLLEFPPGDIFKLPQPYGCVNILHMDKGSRHWDHELIL